MTRPLVSVVVPVKDGERFLAPALESAFAQDYEPFEVIVVDDGSTDRSAEIARSWPVRYVWQEQAGASAARNTGIAAARGELIAFLDADDLWEPGSLALRVDHLLAHPEVDFVMAHMHIFLEPGTPKPHWWAPGWSSGPQQGQLQTYVGRRQAIDATGPFDSSFDPSEDVEWLTRAKDTGRGVMLPDVCARYRIHEGGTTYHRDEVTGSLVMRALAQSIARRRAATERSAS